MNEFAFLAKGYREYMWSTDLPTLSMRLAETPLQRNQAQQSSELSKEVLAASTS